MDRRARDGLDRRRRPERIDFDPGPDFAGGKFLRRMGGAAGSRPPLQRKICQPQSGADQRLVLRSRRSDFGRPLHRDRRLLPVALCPRVSQAARLGRCLGLASGQALQPLRHPVHLWSLVQRRLPGQRTVLHSDALPSYQARGPDIRVARPSSRSPAFWSTGRNASSIATAPPTN